MPEEISTQTQSQNEMSRAVPLFTLGLLLLVAFFYGGYWCGIGRTQITKPPAPISQPATTPTPIPSKIAFVRDGGIWVVNPDGSGEKKIVEGRPEKPIKNLLWSPDGKKLAYILGVKITTNPETQIQTVDYDLRYFDLETDTSHIVGESVFSFTAWSTSKHKFAWSPNNDSIVYVSEGSVKKFDLATKRVGGLENVRCSECADVSGSLFYHPSGDKIYFLTGDADEAGRDENYLVEYNFSSEETEGWFLGFGVEYLDLSPDGTKIAYITVDTEYTCTLHTMDVATGEPKSVISTLGALANERFMEVGWSPNGRYLALSSALVDAGTVRILDMLGNVLYRAEADPTDLFEEVYGTQFTSEEEIASVVGSVFADFAWSPDSRSLLRVIHIVYPKGLPSLIVKYDLETGKLTKITTTDSFISPVWSPAFDF